MSFPPAPRDDSKSFRDPKRPPSTNRIILWLVVGGVGAYLFITGLVGVIAKGG